MKVLVVEDNKKLARFLMRALAEDGHAVDLVGDGRQAVTQIRDLKYDLVILDWMLPELDGLSVVREVRDRGARVPILMLTARAEVSERIAGLDAGADDYLPKPFDLAELLARVRALSRRGTPGEGPLKTGPLLLDRAERKATLSGQRLELTPRLAREVREAGRVVPRMEILAKVWEMSFDPGSNVIEVHVKNLREKLGDHAHLIETVRGVGYRLISEPDAP